MSKSWLLLIVGAYAALALLAAFAPRLLNTHLGSSPATLGLLAAFCYLVLVIVVMGIASRPFDSGPADGDS